MRAIFESLFDVAYLAFVLSIGLLLFLRSTPKTGSWFFGIMAVVLGAGDAFHLVPRMVGLLGSGLEAIPEALGIGKLVTSITMTVFYVLLFHIAQRRYGLTGRGLLWTIYALAIARVVLCLFPGNQWLQNAPSVQWGIIRNIPFVIMGLIILWLYYRESKRNRDRSFQHMWLAIALSFAFYVPVVLWGEAYTWVGMLMIPKTLAYAWIVYMGYAEFRKART